MNSNGPHDTVQKILIPPPQKPVSRVISVCKQFRKVNISSWCNDGSNMAEDTSREERWASVARSQTGLIGCIMRANKETSAVGLKQAVAI